MVALPKDVGADMQLCLDRQQGGLCLHGRCNHYSDLHEAARSASDHLTDNDSKDRKAMITSRSQLNIGNNLPTAICWVSNDDSLA